MKINKETILIELEKDKDTLWNNIHKNFRTDIKKAKNRFNIKVSTTKSKEDISICKEILEQHNKRLFTPLPNNYTFYSKDDVLFVSKYENKIIGFGIAGPQQKSKQKTAVMKWAANLPEHNQTQSNTLLYWEIILYLKSKKFKYLDLGGSDYGTKDPQLLRLKKYKEKWNGLKKTSTQDIGIVQYLWLKYLRRYTIFKRIKYFLLTKFSSRYRT